MRIRNFLATAALAMPLVGLQAQTPAYDPSARLREVLPADVAERVLSRIADARARELPAEALANRALKFASRGVAPAEIERSVNDHAERLGEASELIATARGARPDAEEIDAGAEALRQGVDGASVSALAKSSPSGRSLAVPLFVMGSLVERGLPSDAALARVRDRLAARASDAELESIVPGRNAAAGDNGQRGIDRAAAARPQGVGTSGTARTPTNVPRNGGQATAPSRPTTPPTGRPTGTGRP